VGSDADDDVVEEVADGAVGEIVVVGKTEVGPVGQVDGKFVEADEIVGVENVETEADSMSDVDLALGEVVGDTVEADVDCRRVRVGEAGAG
jgi:hypothetical protein